MTLSCWHFDIGWRRSHDCARTRLCPHTTHLCPDTFGPWHIWALTCYNRVVTIVFGQKCVRLCPETFLPRYIFGALTCYNKLTRYSSSNTAGDCWTQVKFANNSWACLCFHQSSWHKINLVDTIIILLLTKDMIVSGHNNSCWGTNVPVQKLVWAQMWGHKRLWHSRVGPIMYGNKRVGTIALAGIAQSY